MHAQPAQVQGCLHCLLVATASGGSRFSRIIRHGTEWHLAPLKMLKIQEALHGLFSDMPDLDSNTRIQIMFLEARFIPTSQCTPLITESDITDDWDVFDKLIARKISTTGLVRGDRKSLLRTIAAKPRHS